MPTGRARGEDHMRLFLGNNKLTLNKETLCQIVEDALNHELTTDEAKVWIDSLTMNNSIGDQTIEFHFKSKEPAE